MSYTKEEKRQMMLSLYEQKLILLSLLKRSHPSDTVEMKREELLFQVKEIDRILDFFIEELV